MGILGEIDVLEYLYDFIVFFLMLRRPLRPTLFPYTTLFRSQQRVAERDLVVHHEDREVAAGGGGARRDRRFGRSEEHTSELQSLAYLVCRLLLEKKKVFYDINL